MSLNFGESSPFVFPDPIYLPEMLSGAAFLYFKKPIILTSPPDVVTWEESKNLIDLIEKEKPTWEKDFFTLLNNWHSIGKAWYHVTQELLKPLKKKFYTFYLSYPADSKSMDESEKFALSGGLSLESLSYQIDPYAASGELLRHIMLEKFLELNKDIDSLYIYCEKLFTGDSIRHLYVKSYFLRWKSFTEMSGVKILLTNAGLLDFLNNLPIENTDEPSSQINNDIIAWEFFRQILSPYLDPLDTEKVELISDILDSREGELEKFRIKCYSLAEQVQEPNTLGKLPTQINRFIKININREITDLLQLDKQALEDFYIDLFQDQKTWLSLLGFISGVISGQSLLTAGTALATLSKVGSSAFKAASERKKRLRESDYTLIYRINRKTTGSSNLIDK